ncbi:MAG: cellulase family glycosylhydrolase [Proteobacteria bacterium]|nr:cellulase family glycosylhydrolase [Pseudomonadota bacterium]
MRCAWRIESSRSGGSSGSRVRAASALGILAPTARQARGARPPGLGLALALSLLAPLALAGERATAAPTAAPTPAPTQPDVSTPEPFVRVEGTRFLVGDAPFAFVGANAHVLHGPEARTQTDATLRAVAADGLRVARVWALGEAAADAQPWERQHFAFRAGPEGWNDEAFRHLDRVLQTARGLGLRLILTLSNHWRDYGGIPMYLRWAGQLDQSAYGYSDRFFTDPRVRGWFLDHVRRLVTRVNALTGVRYADDPTIMAWELQNELHGTPEAAGARRAWVVAMSRAVRGFGARQLVVPGALGYDLQLERDEWIALCQLPEVSYCDHHVYPASRLQSATAARLRRYIDDRTQLALFVVGKPLVWGEFGFAQETTGGSRATWHARFLERAFFDGASGALVWIYQPSLPWKGTYRITVGQPQYRPVRRVLARFARRVAERAVEPQNLALGPARGRALINPTHVLLRGWAGVHRAWQREPGGGWRLQIDVDRFGRAWFEEAGAWDGGVLVHAYGRRTGWFEYRFVAPPAATGRLLLRVRASSEYPGSASPPEGWTAAHVELDGQRVGPTLDAPADDGLGAWRELILLEGSADRALSPGIHRLRFVVEPGPQAHGLALYGREGPLNREPVEGGSGPIELHLEALPRSLSRAAAPAAKRRGRAHPRALLAAPAGRPPAAGIAAR